MQNLRYKDQTNNATSSSEITVSSEAKYGAFIFK
jgi:hypothetical protein